jgi:ABC-type sugar transport system permease subunit
MKMQPVTRKNFFHNWIIFLMMAPSLIGIALFSYGPAIEAVRHSFYNWDGLFTEEFIGSTTSAFCWETSPSGSPCLAVDS